MQVFQSVGVVIQSIILSHGIRLQYNVKCKICTSHGIRSQKNVKLIHKEASTNQLTVSVSTSFELGSVKNIPFRRPDNFCSVFSHVDGTFIVNP